jgi:hypothetical protein
MPAGEGKIFNVFLQCTSIKCILSETSVLPNDTIPQRKKTALPPGNNQKTCFEGSGYNVCKKNCDPLLYHQAVRIAGAQVLSAPDKSSILAHFLFQKTMVFLTFYGIGFSFFSSMAH